MNADAAIPSTTHTGTIETRVDTPRDPRIVGCPNCKAADAIVVISTATIEQRAEQIRWVGTSVPEVEFVDEYEDAAVIREKRIEIVGVRCETCRWGYTGPDPLNRLVEVER